MLSSLSELVQSSHLDIAYICVGSTNGYRNSKALDRELTEFPIIKVHWCRGRSQREHRMTDARNIPPLAIRSIWQCHKKFCNLCCFIRVNIIQVDYYFTKVIKSLRGFTHSNERAIPLKSHKKSTSNTWHNNHNIEFGDISFIFS